jgi:hypothetical protein
MPTIRATWRIQVSRPAQANSSETPICEITRAKWTKGVTQVAEYKHLHEALSSNPSPTKKKQKRSEFGSKNTNLESVFIELIAKTA